MNFSEINMEEIFIQLSETLEQCLESKDWKKAVLEITRLDNAVRFTGYFIDNLQNQQNINVRFGFYDAEAVHQLYDLTVTHPLEHQNWNRAIFTLYPSDEFEIEYIWDEALEQELNNLEIA